ncbi:hypothetical protein NEAUS06_2163 [Nematocida ausubeli]|nr:hypothetical protein NEAUS06_2163 [Nematocida ausubeli]
MYCLNIDRFKESSFHIQEYLEEIYEECMKRETTSCESIITELEKIKEALHYKEEEIKDKNICFSGRGKIEELGNALSSIELSPESTQFIQIMQERDLVKKRGRYIGYCSLVEEDALLSNVESSAQLLEIAEFVQLLTCLASASPPPKKVHSSILGTLSSVFGSSPEKEDKEASETAAFQNAQVIKDLDLSEASSLVVSEELLHRLKRYRKKIISLAKESYSSAIEKNNLEEAMKTAVLFYTLDLKTYPIEYLINNQKPLPYTAAFVADIDVVKDNALPDLNQYLTEVAERIEETVHIIKDMLINNHYMLDKSKSASVQNPAEIFLIIKKLLSNSFLPVTAALNSIDDPVEYLITLETILMHTTMLKDRICYILPCIKTRLKKHSVLHISEDLLLENETASMRVIFDGLSKAVITKKSTLKYKINGEVLTALKTPLEAVFRYMAYCHKVANRSAKLEYSPKILELLFNFQLRGFTLILDGVFSRKYAPYLGTKLHLDVYLCIKKYYKKVRTQSNEGFISSVLGKLNQIEAERNKNISSSEMHYLITRLDDLLGVYNTEETIDLLSSSFNYLPSAPIYKSIIKETFNIFYIKIKEKVYTRTTLKDVKRSIQYISALYKYSKTLKTPVDKSLKRLKDLLDSALVDESDLNRIFDLVKATSEEQKVIKRIRESINSKTP